jgi:hypothetical protein
MAPLLLRNKSPQPLQRIQAPPIRGDDVEKDSAVGSHGGEVEEFGVREWRSYEIVSGC